MYIRKQHILGTEKLSKQVQGKSSERVKSSQIKVKTGRSQMRSEQVSFIHISNNLRDEAGQVKSKIKWSQIKSESDKVT